MDFPRLAVAIEKAEAFKPTKGQLQGLGLGELKRYAGDVLLNKKPRGEAGTETFLVGTYAQFVLASEKLEAATAHLDPPGASTGRSCWTSLAGLDGAPAVGIEESPAVTLAKVRASKPPIKAWSQQSAGAKNLQMVQYDPKVAQQRVARAQTRDQPVLESWSARSVDAVKRFMASRRCFSAVIIGFLPIILAVVPRLLMLLIVRWVSKVLEATMAGLMTGTEQVALEVDKASDRMFDTVAKHLDVPVRATEVAAELSPGAKTVSNVLGVPGWFLLGTLYIVHTSVQALANRW